MMNIAAWSDEPKADVRVGPADLYTPGPRELLVRNECIAFSPVDFKNQKFLLHPMPYPNILGSSFAGIVEKVGPEVTDFRPGDKVAVNRPSSSHDDHRFGAFQKYALASVSETARLEPSASLQAAAATIVNLSVAVSALSVHLGLERPPLSHPAETKHQKVLIYGGSSSCGGYAVKYAAEAGYSVITTSSPNHERFVSQLGAMHVIDHTQSQASIVAELKAHGPYNAMFDAIGLPMVTDIFSEYLEATGGSYCSLLPLLGGEKPVPPTVDRRFAAYSSALVSAENEELGEWYYKKYVPIGLERGRIVPTRQMPLEGGLEKVQEAVNKLGPVGVSGFKLVLDPQGKTELKD